MRNETNVFGGLFPAVGVAEMERLLADSLTGTTTLHLVEAIAS